MKLIALLCFYDEPVKTIAGYLLGIKGAGVDHLVVVDGAYGLYPDGKAESHPDQHAALAMGCRQLGIGLTLHVPPAVWDGNEVEKRNCLFDLGYAVSTPVDWFVVLDTDEHVREVPSNLREALEASPYDAGQVRMIDTLAIEANEPRWAPELEDARLFRAQRIHVEVRHNTWVTEDGRYLRHGLDPDKLEDVLDLSSFVVDHKPNLRPTERLRDKQQYYARRDELGVERGTCDWCDERAVRLVTVNWTMNETYNAPTSEWKEACVAHVATARRISDFQLRELGYDPNHPGLRIENRNRPAAAREPAGAAA